MSLLLVCVCVQLYNEMYNMEFSSYTAHPVDAGTIHHECESSLALTHGYRLELEVRNENLIHFVLPRKNSALPTQSFLLSFCITQP